jgi:hypothetical protein
MIEPEKLSSLTSKFLLVVCTANPGKEDWLAGVEGFNRKSPFHLESLTSPEDFPSSYYIGLLKIMK